MGRQFGDQVVIEVATLPGKGDVQKPFFMQRDKRRGQKIIDYFWRLSGSELVLAGEWHTHPEAFPNLSQLDKSEAIISIEKNFYPLGFMVIVIISSEAVVKSWFGVCTDKGLSRIERTGYQLAMTTFHGKYSHVAYMVLISHEFSVIKIWLRY